SDAEVVLPDAWPDREYRDEWRARDAGQDERPDPERRWTAEELDLLRARRGSLRTELQADDFVAAKGLEQGQRAEDGPAGVDDVETVTRAEPVHELARGRVRLRCNDEVHGSTEVGKKTGADLRPAEVSGGHNEPPVLCQRRLEELGTGDVERTRWWARASLLEALGHGTRELGEDAVRVPALAKPSARPAHLPLIAKHGGTALPRDRENDARDDRRRAALPPFGAVHAPELREATPGTAVEPQCGTDARERHRGGFAIVIGLGRSTQESSRCTPSPAFPCRSRCRVTSPRMTSSSHHHRCQDETDSHGSSGSCI